MNSPQLTGWKNWIAVSMLGVASFTVVATELAPIGMLSAIANDMGQNASVTGLVVTLYAWLGAVAALLSVMTISHLPRRPLLVGLMILLALSNFISATSQNFTLLLIARLVGAIAHGAFWAMIGTMGAQLVSSKQVGRATAIIFGGVSAASVLEVPLINWISNDVGWRLSFTALGLLSLITAFTLVIFLPHVSGSESIGRNQFTSVLKNINLKKAYLIATCAIVAHFSAFTFIELLLSSKIAVDPNWIVICLFAFGIAGLFGNFVCGVFIDRYLKRVLTIGLLLIILCLLIISLIMNIHSISNKWWMLLLVSGWGFGIAILFVGIQSWILRLAGKDALPASAIYASIFNAALGTGAIVGAGILGHWGLNSLYLIAALATLFSLFVLMRVKIQPHT